jgi:hypothetical protein
VAPIGHLVHLGDESPRVTNIQRSSMKCSCLENEWVTQELTQICSRRLGFDWNLREREFELKKLWFKGFSSQWRGQVSGVGGDPLLYPHREYACLGCQRSGHVRSKGRTYPENLTGIRSGHQTSLEHQDLARVRLLGRTCSARDRICLEKLYGIRRFHQTSMVRTDLCDGKKIDWICPV